MKNKVKLSKFLENKYTYNYESEKELSASIGYRLITLVFEGIDNEDDNSCLYLDFENLCDSRQIDMRWYDGSENFDEDIKMFDFQIEVDENQIKEFNQAWRFFKQSLRK